MPTKTASPDSGRMLHRDIVHALLAGLLVFAALPAAADDDLPGRVARIADVAGDLFLAPQDAPDQWNAIGQNYPVTTGDNLYLGKDGRAEVDFGGGQFRLSGDTSLHVSRLDDRNFALFIAQGSVILRVRVLESGESARIDTPNTQVVLTRAGLYRIEVAADGQHSLVAVREGEATVDTGLSVQQVLPGQNATLDGPGPAYVQLRNGILTDGFDTWSASRDRRYERGRGNAPISRQMVGSADLDEYGAWESAPEYGGAVWYPANVAPDWAPYRDGYWTEVGVWGPTWVDAAPWGYAPFHYGRWAHIRGRWGWCPGGYVARPVWAPALVGWVGGPGWRVGAGAPVYGWVPLGWGESYQPHWRGCSDGCWARYNRPYAVNTDVRIHTPPARYANWNAPGAVTAVSGPPLSGRKLVPANLVTVNSTALATAPVLVTPPVSRAARQPGGVRPGDGVPQPASTIYAAAPRKARPFAPAEAVPAQGGAPPTGRTVTGGVPQVPAPIVAKPQPIMNPPPVSVGSGMNTRAPTSLSAPPSGTTPVAVPLPAESKTTTQSVPVPSAPSSGTSQHVIPPAGETRPRMPPPAQPATPGPAPSAGYVPQGAIAPPKPVQRAERIPIPATLAPAPPAAAPAPRPVVVAPAPTAAPAMPAAVAPHGHPQESPKVDKPAVPKVPGPAEAAPK